MKIRLATCEDASSLLAIYAPYVKDSVITFETSVPSLETFQQRMKEIMQVYPYLVVEEHDQIIGYAYAHRMFARSAYDWDVELSEYFDINHTSKGYGSCLLQALLEILQLQGIRNAYSLITLPNVKSEGMHQKFNFHLCGVYHKTGYKHGTWLDVGIYEKCLNPYDTPSPIQTIQQLYPQTIQILSNQSKE